MSITQKRVLCLYRVSTPKQMDREKNDIPMQQNACREFITSQPGWYLYKEKSENGVSGFKVAAKDRGAIQEIQQDALGRKFDVLLVFMFDRLGRRDDETPFVVEWFVQHGIEVWSVIEGEQRFDSHVDKLTNYIRYWQASGESIKTSMRVAAGQALIVESGHFRGGKAPYGYRLEKQGRINKKGHEVFDLLINDAEAMVVRKIFDLYLSCGYGSKRISTHLLEQGIRNRAGGTFTNATIKYMLKSKIYIGILFSRNTISNVLEKLQIISPDVFEEVQNMMKMRSTEKDKRTIPLRTSGNNLLAGNIFCGHCGARLTTTTSNKSYRKKDGTITTQQRTRYSCYNRRCHKNLCDGQTGYTARQLDQIIDEIVRRLSESLTVMDRDTLIEQRCTEEHIRYTMELIAARATQQAFASEVLTYEAEVIKVIRGESLLTADLLNKLYAEAKSRVDQTEKELLILEKKAAETEQTKFTLIAQFDILKNSFAQYPECSIEEKKVIITKLFHTIHVKRGYEVEINLSDLCKAFGLSV